MEEQAAIMAWWNTVPASNPYKLFTLQVVMSWWTDLNPADNTVTFNLATGE